MKRAVVAALLALGLLGSSCSMLRERAQEHEVWRTDSGLVMRDLILPDGPSALPGSTVTLHYEGFVVGGEKFDSTKDRGLPVTFVLGQDPVPGWLAEGVLGMRLYGERVLRVPPELAYGAEGLPPLIPPDATLRVRLELLELEPAATDPSGIWSDRGNGLLVEILEEGSGRAAAIGDRLSVAYVGTFATDGAPFTSSDEHGGPHSFELGRGQVLEGWDRGLEGLRQGTRAILHVPAAQAYGTAGWPGRVPPDMPLRYEIELLSVRPGE